MASTTTVAPPASLAERFRLWRWRNRQSVIAFAILGPMLLYFVVFTWIPILVMAAISFTEWNVIQWPPTFVGLDNYQEILTDKYYHNVVWRTVEIGGTVPVLEMSVGFGIALLLNQALKGRAIYRTIWYLPVVISGAVLAQTLLVFLYPARFGGLNSLLIALGNEPVIWTRSEFWMPFWVIMFSFWRGVGGGVIFFLAGLQSVDSSLYEAARVEGGGRWGVFGMIMMLEVGVIRL